MICQCPHCSKKVDVSDMSPGDKATCPYCQRAFLVPEYPMGRPEGHPQASMTQAPKNSRMAIASLVLALIGFLTVFLGLGFFLALVGLILGIAAIRAIRQQPAELSGHGLALAGIITSGFILFVGLMGAISLTAIPILLELRMKAYDASAKSAGLNAKVAQEIWYNEQGGEERGTYTHNLSDLLTVDNTLEQDEFVTFRFGTCNSKGYTFWTEHAKGSGMVFTYTD